MATRRAFLSGATVSSVMLAVPAARATSAPPAPARPMRAVIDHSLLPGHIFAERARTYGAAIDWFTGDVSTLWLTELAPMLRNRAEPIVGLTRAGALFCLERWAWDLRMRVVMRIDHLATVSGSRQHCGATPLMEVVAARLDASGPAFPSYTADLAFGGRNLWSDCTHATTPRSPGALFDPIASWVIAPASARA
ncbi:MAG: hypothetical protein JF608_02185 [Sphingomonadales bacterium]|nr:hypothetical protein [Sphingomonadales bacterium]